LNRLARIKQTAANGTTVNKRADYVYNADGTVQSVARYSNDGTTAVASSAYAYDNMGRLIGLTHTPAGGTAFSYGYSYDAAGRIVGMTNSAHAGENFSADYDATDQLTDVDYSSLDDEGYVYDGAE
jgi:YD repeat-containing protein